VIEPRLLTDIQTCRAAVCIRLLEKLQVCWPHNFEHVKQVLRKKIAINLNFIKRREKCIYFYTIIQYKPTKCTFAKLIFLIFLCLLHFSDPTVHLQEDGCVYRYVVVRFTCIKFDSRVGRRVCSTILLISDALRHITEEPQTILHKWKPTLKLQGAAGTLRVVTHV